MVTFILFQSPSSAQSNGGVVVLWQNGLSGTRQVGKFSLVGFVLPLTAHLCPPSPCPCFLASAAAPGSERCRQFCPLPPRPSSPACPCPTRFLPPLAPVGQKQQAHLSQTTEISSTQCYRGFQVSNFHTQNTIGRENISKSVVFRLQ